MTPSNNPNGEPLIYRICDAVGVFHLVAPVDHHHSQDEIDGLAAALTAKANAADVQTALEGKQNALTFDTTPTANSTNPVTSGGVEAAIIPAINQNLDDLYAGDTGHDIYTIIDENVGEGFLYLSLKMGRPPLVRYCQTIVGARGIKIRSSDNKAAYGEWERYYYLTDHDVDATPTANSNNPVSSGGVKAALDVQKRINNRQLQLTKTADGYQFVNSESDLPTFVNMIKSWGGEEDYVCVNCIVLTDGDGVAMPAIFNWSETSSYITIRAFIGCYLLEGGIRKNGSSYSSDIMMQLEDRSYVFSE